MKKHILFSVLALYVMANGALANATHDSPPPPPPAHEDAMGVPPEGMNPKDPHKEWTLEEARKKAHEHAEKLDKMTPEQWAEHQKKRKEFMEKWHNMTPEQKEDFRKKREEHRKQKEESSTPAPTSPQNK